MHIKEGSELWPAEIFIEVGCKISFLLEKDLWWGVSPLNIYISAPKKQEDVQIKPVVLPHMIDITTDWLQSSAFFPALLWLGMST